MTIFLGCGFAAKYREGGGNFSVPLQWILGLQRLKLDAIWLELLPGTDAVLADQLKIRNFQRQLRAHGLAGRYCLLYQNPAADTHDLDSLQCIGISKRELLERLAGLATRPVDLAALHAQWVGMFELDAPMVDLAHRLSEGYRVYLLSNIGDLHWAHLSREYRFQTIDATLPPETVTEELARRIADLLVLTQDGRIAKQLIGDDSQIEKEYLVRVEGKIKDPAGFGRIIVARRAKGPVYLNEVADIVDGEREADPGRGAAGPPSSATAIHQPAHWKATGSAMGTSPDPCPASHVRQAPRAWARSRATVQITASPAAWPSRLAARCTTRARARERAPAASAPASYFSRRARD